MKELIVPFTDDEFAFHIKHYGEYEEVIRCKDCKHYSEYWKACEEFDYRQLPEVFYCASAERKDE